MQQLTYAWILSTCDACERSSSVDSAKSAAVSVGRESLVLTVREAGRTASFGHVDSDNVVQAHIDFVCHFELFLIEFS